MTPEQLQQAWERARQFEVAGALDEARAAYAGILASSPRQVMVQLRLSMLEQAAGRYRAARQHALDASRVVGQTQRWEALPFLTLRLLDFEERELVHRLIVDSDWSSPQVLSQAPALSQHLSLCGHEDDALRLIDAAVRRSQPSHLLEYSRANALRHRGQMDEATAAYERCIALAPAFAYAHWSLAYHAPAAPGTSRIARIREALAICRADAAACAHLHYALFKELDSAGEPDAAWAELRAGTSLMRDLQPYDGLLEEAGVSTLLSSTNRPVPKTNAADANARVPVFIVGMPRTGTTVLERILGGHAQVADAGELNDFQHAASLVSDHFIHFPPDAAQAGLLAQVDAQDIGRIYLERTERYYGHRSHLVDKNPQNFFAAGLIARALPQARILCLVRASADACFSNLKELFTPGAYAYSYGLEDVADHYARFGRLLAHWRDTLPDNFLVVSYEDLVANPVKATEQVLRFCGLPAEPECVDITRNHSRASTASSSQIRQPIHAGNVGAWRRYQHHLQPMIERLRQHGIAPEDRAGERADGAGP